MGIVARKVLVVFGSSVLKLTLPSFRFVCVFGISCPKFFSVYFSGSFQAVIFRELITAVGGQKWWLYKCVECGEGSSPSGVLFILLRSHRLLEDDGDTVHVLTYVQQKCFCSLSLEGTLQMRFLSEKYVVLKLCCKETIPATLNNPPGSLPKQE